MELKRRTFLKISAMSGVGAILGCSSDVDKTLYPLVTAPDDMVTGKARHYASTCRECPAGCGILVKTREERALKIEGNPLHPVNHGKICMRGQAAVQGVYHPDRLKTPLLKDAGRFREIGLDEAMAIFRDRTRAAAAGGANRVRMLTDLPGESLRTLFEAAAEQWNSDPPLFFEPLGCESLKAAAEILFERPAIPDYSIRNSDFILSFGADFIETWLSPVSYARRFKEMHAYSEGKKGLFFHLSSHHSLTAANADRWFCCRPGSKHRVALWMIRELLENESAEALPADAVAWLKPLVSGVTRKAVSEETGIETAELDTLLSAFRASHRPVVLGGNAAGGNAALPVELSALLLNWVRDPSLSRIDFDAGHRLADAAGASEVTAFFEGLAAGPAEVLILHRANPVYALPNSAPLKTALEKDSLFVVSFTDIPDDTARFADLIIPVCHPLESWDAYSSRRGFVSLLQPAMAPPGELLQVGDILLQTAFDDDRPAENYKTFLADHLARQGYGDADRIQGVRQGGFFPVASKTSDMSVVTPTLSDMAGHQTTVLFDDPGAAGRAASDVSALRFMAVPSIRFFDGRSGYAPWLSEVPDPLTCVAWQTPVLLHPETMTLLDVEHEDLVRLETEWGRVEAVAYETEGVHPQAVAMQMGQGHSGGGRYADGKGINPLALLPPDGTSGRGVPVTVRKIKTGAVLANTDGSRIQHGRKIALSVSARSLATAESHDGKAHSQGLGMNDFPLTLPLPEGYDADRDIYPPHDHVGYRWAMTVDLDRCIGCGACAVACYAENNLGIVGEKQIIAGREMAWLRVERYHDMDDARRITFLPMMCQHCDNAPCESVCPVYAPHHSKEGLNNQVYNRCIGTRFCSQNCPYKVRRFNWFDWEWPTPLNRQLNPDVTVRAKGVMEKCSFCVQRIKEAHGRAKDEGRDIRDGEVTPACVQTCPTDALVFGNLMDTESRVRKLAEGPRAYQVMGYLNTKPAVIYLKKVRQDTTKV